jgi:superfamily II DNA/RNA helicase
MKEYVHRAGRLAQAGQAGHALLFLLPSERQYVEVLELRSLRDISPLSLSSTLSSAAALCRDLMQEGELRASTGSYNDADGDDVDPDDGNGRPP